MFLKNVFPHHNEAEADIALIYIDPISMWNAMICKDVPQREDNYNNKLTNNMFCSNISWTLVNIYQCLET